MRICGLISGGKDSAYALYRAIKDGSEVACLASIMPSRPDSWMFHRPLVELTRLQAEAMGFGDRHFMIPVSGVKEAEVEELREGLRGLKARYDFDAITVGGVASRYQYDRFSAIARDLGVKVFDPQWGEEPEEYLRRLVREGIVFIISQITTAGLPERLLGVPMQDEVQVEEILSLSRKCGFHPAFEGGEAETFVVAAPHFSRGICLRGSRVKMAEYQYALSVSEARLCGDVVIVVDSESYLVRRRSEFLATASRTSGT
jgi:ABC transporter with metal-binding/Fe-S-binding domain ATP-binding protein